MQYLGVGVWGCGNPEGQTSQSLKNASMITQNSGMSFQYPLSANKVKVHVMKDS